MTDGAFRRRLKDRLGATWIVTALGILVVAGIGVLMSASLRSGLQEIRDARRSQAAAAVSHEAIVAITAIQIERGLAELLQAFGERGDLRRYEEAVATTDRHLASLREAWATHREALTDAAPPSMGDALASTRSLPAIRDGVGVPGEDSTFEAYSSLVDVLLGANQSIGVLANNGSPVRSALGSLLRAAESLGRERALVASLLASGQPASGNDRVRLSLLERDVRVGLRSASGLLGEPMAARISAVSTGPIATEAQTLLALIESGSDDGSYQVAPAEWFDEATARIDALVAIATDVNQGLAAAATTRIDSARRDLAWRSLGLGSLLLVAIAGTGAAVLASRERATALREYAELAAGLQRWFLPESLPDIPGLELAARYLPASQRTRAGGDWYDLYEVGPQRVAIVIGDVAGHGPHASAQMAEIRNLLRGQSIAYPKSPGAQLGLLEKTLRDSNVFATAFIGTLDLDSGALRYSRAGHMPPVTVDRAGNVTVHAEAGGVPIGAGLTDDWPEAEVFLAPGSILLVYTDGLVESRRMSLDEGIGQLADSFPTPGDGLDDVADALIAARPDSANEDDIALLLLRWVPSA